MRISFAFAFAFALAACGEPADVGTDAGPDVVVDAGPELDACRVRCEDKPNGDRGIVARWPGSSGDPVVSCCECQEMLADTDPTICGDLGILYSKEQQFSCGLCECGGCGN